MTVAHKILLAAYQLLPLQVSYHELGDAYLDNLDKSQLNRNLVRRLERLGYKVVLEEKVA